MNGNIDIRKLTEAAKHPHHPYVAALTASGHALMGKFISVVSGSSAYDAIWNILGMIRLLMPYDTEPSGWEAVICRCEPDGSLSEPVPANQQELDVLTEFGMSMILYVHADGSTS